MAAWFARFVGLVVVVLCAAVGHAWAADTFPGTTLTGSSGSVVGTTVGMTGQSGEPNFTGGATTSDWYSWTATASGRFTIGTCNLTAETVTNTDTTLAAYTGAAVGSLTTVGTNDDTTGCNSTVSANYGSFLTFNAVSGTTYRFQVDTYQNSAQGGFTLRWGLSALDVVVSDSTATEGGDTASFTVRPVSPPAGSSAVTVTIGTSPQCSFSPTTLSFTSANFTTPQTVTVTATNDGTAEGTHSCTPASIAASGTGYGGITFTPTPTITIYDNDNPAFTISKSASLASISAPGTITYTITVDNTGTAVLTSPTISDTLTQNGSARTLTSGPTLTSGDVNSDGIVQDTETWVYTATYAVTQANIDTGGSFSNTATFDPAELPAATSAAAVTTITQSPSFTNVKAQSGGSNPVTLAGQTINYSITIDNTGNVTLTAPTLVSDTFQLGGSARTLTSGPAYSSGDADSDGAIDTTEVWVYTASYTVTQADLDATGDFTNLNQFDTAQTAPVTSNTVTTPVTRTPSFTNVKAQSGGANPVTLAGQTITYSITIDNTGNQTLTTPAVVSDTLQLGGAARTLTSGPTYSSGDADSDGAIDTTEIWIYTASYTVTQADLDATGDFTNLLQFDTAQTAPLNSNTVTTPVTRTPSFTLVKAQSAGPSPITAAGQVITYTLTIDNTGNQSLTAPTVVSDTFQLGGSARALSSGPSYTSGDADSDGAIDTSEIWIYTATYTVPQMDIDGTGSFTNLAQFDTAQTAPVTSNTVTTNVTRTASFTNVKAQSGGSNPVTLAGQTITYSITIDNTGNQTLTAPTVVSDTFQLGGAARTLTSGPTYSSGDSDSDGAIDITEIWVYTASYTVTQADLDATGSFTNLNQFDTAQTAPVTSNTVTTPVTRAPSFTVVKAQSSGPSPVTLAGQVIGYSITVDNTGNQTLTGLSITDTFQLGGSARTLTSGPTYSSGDSDSDGAIDTTEVWVYSASYTVPQTDIDGTGSFTNSATYDTTQTAPSTSNTVTTNVTRTASFSILKGQSGGPDPVTAQGQTIAYLITISNTGNQTLTGLSLTDALLQAGSPRTLTSGPTYSSGDSNSDGEVDVGEIWLYNATYTVTLSDMNNGGTFSNTATFDTAQTASSTSTAVTTPVTQSPLLSIDKTFVITTDGGTPGVADVGDIVTYYYDVTNTGNVTISSISVADVHGGSGTPPTPSPASVASLAPSATTQFTATYQVTQIDVDNQ